MSKQPNPVIGQGRTIIAGIVSIVAGALAAAHSAVQLDADHQARIIELIAGLMAIAGGGGSIVFRILANIPTIVAAFDELNRLRGALTGKAPAPPAQPPAT